MISHKRKGTSMKNTIVGLFEDRTEAQRAQSDIVRLNIPIGDTKVFDQSASMQSEAAGASDQSWWDSFKQAIGLGESDEGSYYEEGIRRGGVLVSVRADDDVIDQVAEIMDAHGAVDIDERAEQWRSSGWTPQPITTGAAGGASTSSSVSSVAGSSAPAAGTTSAMSPGPSAGEAASMPVIQEELRVGKREVRRGGVRIYRRVTEQPVEETERLRDETVRVDRQAVNRPATAETGSFKNETIEMTEIVEEPVVSKQARVVEEVTLHKEVREREETVRDTVRRSDVEVESTSGTTATTPNAWDDQEARVHWTSHYGSGGMAYEQYDPAYRFGARLAGGANMDSSDWTQLEPEARRSWEAEHQGTWEQFKDAVRYSWQRAKQKVSPSSERRAA